MSQTVTPIALGSGVFGVNCYRITTERGFVLVDTGTRRQPARIEEKLCPVNCDGESAKLIFITHGDFDRIGHAAYVERSSVRPSRCMRVTS